MGCPYLYQDNDDPVKSVAWKTKIQVYHNYACHEIQVGQITVINFLKGLNQGEAFLDMR